MADIGYTISDYEGLERETYNPGRSKYENQVVAGDRTGSGGLIVRCTASKMKSMGVTASADSTRDGVPKLTCG